MKTSARQVEKLAEITHLFPTVGPRTRGDALVPPEIEPEFSSGQTEAGGASAGKQASDQKRADEVCTALAGLQEAMDSAIRSGLEVELNMRQVSGRFAGMGSQADSLVGDVKVFRQLV